MSAKIRVIIVDDESPARRKIQRFLADAEDFEVIAEAGTGTEAVCLIQQHQPDLVFLDVQMPGLDGFAVVESLDVSPMPLIIFTTAFDQFALRAFEVHAFDYLLKPFDYSRFQTALERARERLRRLPQEDIGDRLNRLLDELRGRERYAARLLVSVDERAFLVPVEEIDLIEAAKNYVNIYAGKKSYLMRGTLEGLYQRLDPAKFIRANRSQVVNADSIKELQPWFHGEYKIILKDGREVSWSRRYLDKNSDFILKRF